MRSAKVTHLKNNNGSWSYRRRVPTRHQKTLGFTMWNEPCGDVEYAEAVIIVTELAKEHDKLTKELDDPDVAEKVRDRAEVKLLDEPAMKIADTLTDIGLTHDNMHMVCRVREKDLVRAQTL